MSSADKEVKNRIDYVKRHQHFITCSSSGLKKEVQHYKWEEKGSISLDEPVKFMDDGMDAGLYGNYTQRKSIKLIISNVGSSSLLDSLKNFKKRISKAA